MADDERDRDEPSGGSPLEAVPGLARIAATTAWRTTGWAAGTSLRATSRVLRAAASGESAADLARDVRSGVRDAGRELLGIVDAEERIRGAVPDPVRDAVPGSVRSAVSEAMKGPAGAPSEADARRDHSNLLLERGRQLLRKSADVRYDEDAHPAYERILGDLAPDEGRILRLLLKDGPQPSVDIRTGGPLGFISSELVAPGMTMIGDYAGCRYLDRVPAYLNNLYRLGMIWFSRETLDDPMPYQVLEVQPQVHEAIKSAGTAPKIVRRSIHLTPFGEDFCRTCMPLKPAEVATLPEHADPPDEPVTGTPPPAAV